MTTTPEANPQVPMVCATAALKTGPVRIGHIVGNFTLPRTVAWTTAAAVLGGALVALLLTPLIPGGGMRQWILAIALGGFLGYLTVTYSPLKDESLLTWVGLQVSTLRRAKRVNGKLVVTAVGAAPVPRQPLGRVRLVRGAVRVAPGRYDDRGVVISARNRNVPDGSWMFGDLIMTTPPPLNTPDTPDLGFTSRAQEPPGRLGRMRSAAASNPSAGSPTHPRPHRPVHGGPLDGGPVHGGPAANLPSGPVATAPRPPEVPR